jgi:phosphoribosylformimino-5-aminoimidazole carboxamide ribotide isomerase
VFNQQYILDALSDLDMRVQYSCGIGSVSKVKELLAIGFYRIVIDTQTLTTQPKFLEQLSQELSGAYNCMDRIVIKVSYRAFQDAENKEDAFNQLIEYIDYCSNLGFFRFLCNDLSKVKNINDSRVNIYKKILEYKPFIRLIACGGICSMEEIEKLKEIKCASAVVGSAIYEDKISIETIQSWNLQTLSSI